MSLADAQRQLSLARRAELELELEEKVAAKERQARTTKARAGYGSAPATFDGLSVAELTRLAKEDMEEIVEVASRSFNLKGTIQKALKCRATSLPAL